MAAMNAKALAELLLVAVVLLFVFTYTNQQQAAPSSTPTATPTLTPTVAQQAEFKTIARSYEPEQYNISGAGIEMQRALSITKDAHVEAVIFSNAGNNDTSVSLLVIIPKRLANSIDEVKINAPDVVVIERDPVVKITYRLKEDDVAALDTRILSGGVDVA